MTTIYDIITSKTDDDATPLGMGFADQQTAQAYCAAMTAKGYETQVYAIEAERSLAEAFDKAAQHFQDPTIGQKATR